MENQDLERNYEKLFGELFKVKFYKIPVGKYYPVQEIPVLNFMYPDFLWNNSVHEIIDYFIFCHAEELGTTENSHIRVYRNVIDGVESMHLYICNHHSLLTYDVSSRCHDVKLLNFVRRKQGKESVWTKRTHGHFINPFEASQIVSKRGALSIPMSNLT